MPGGMHQSSNRDYYDNILFNIIKLDSVKTLSMVPAICQRLPTASTGGFISIRFTSVCSWRPLPSDRALSDGFAWLKKLANQERTSVSPSDFVTCLELFEADPRTTGSS